jgi:hypothetical protein
LAKDTKDIGKSNLKIKGYSMEEVSEVGRSGFFKLKVARMSLTEPLANLDECSIKVKIRL